MEGRIDKIGSGFRRGNLQAVNPQMARQARGNQGLAAPRSRCGKDEPAPAQDLDAPTQSSTECSRTTSPITTIAGGGIPAALLPSSPRVDTTTDCSAVV